MSDPVDLPLTVSSWVPADPADRQRFSSALVKLAEVFPLAEPEPSPDALFNEAAFRLAVLQCERVDPDDGTDRAKMLVAAYHRARADVRARYADRPGKA